MTKQVVAVKLPLVLTEKLMDKQYIEIAKGFSGEIRRQYPDISITSIRFVAIAGDMVDVSALPYNLSDATYALVLCNFDYPFHNTYHSNFFALFIDDKGCASSKLRVDDWVISFDEPMTGGGRPPARHCFFKRNDLCLDISCIDCDVCGNISLLWKLFKQVSQATDKEIIQMTAPYTVGNTLYLYKVIREFK